MDFLLIALLILLNGAFAMSELALASSRRARLQAMAESGDPGARSALALMDRPTQFLSSVQVGITSIGVLNGIVGEAAFADDVARVLVALGLPERASGATATAVVVAVITFVTIVFGELVPKRIGQLHPEAVARLIALPMTGVARATRPFVWLLAASTQAVLRLLRIDNSAARRVTEEEIVASLAEGVSAGVIERQEQQMVRNVFHLDDRPLTSMMLPRDDIAWFDADWSVAECLRRAGGGDAHSWYPVCRGSLDDVVGIVPLARLLALGVDHAGPVGALAQPAQFLPETLSGMELLEMFRARASRMVFVVDEYGVVQGMVTPHDLLEAITGELKPDQPADAWATPQADGSWRLDGLMPVSELKARLDIAELPDEDRGLYNTVAGLLMAVSGRLPAVGDTVGCAGWRFEVLSLEGRRIDRVQARRDEGGAGAGDEEEG